MFYAVAVAFLIVAMAGLVIGISMSRSITGAVHSLYEGTAACGARRFFAFDSGEGARPDRRTEHLVQHHDAESGAPARRGERERAHGSRDRDRARSAGSALSQRAAGVRKPAGAGKLQPGAHGFGRLLRLPVGGRQAGDRDWRRGGEGNFGGAADGHHSGRHAHGAARDHGTGGNGRALDERDCGFQPRAWSPN